MHRSVNAKSGMLPWDTCTAAMFFSLDDERTTGEIAPRPHAGGRQPGCDAAALAFVRQLVQTHPDATLEELCAQLQQQRGLRVSGATMCRMLQRLGLPRKKSHSMPLSARPRGSNTPARSIVSGSPP